MHRAKLALCMRCVPSNSDCAQMKFALRRGTSRACRRWAATQAAGRKFSHCRLVSCTARIQGRAERGSASRSRTRRIPTGRIAIFGTVGLGMTRQICPGRKVIVWNASFVATSRIRPGRNWKIGYTIFTPTCCFRPGRKVTVAIGAILEPASTQMCPHRLPRSFTCRTELRRLTRLTTHHALRPSDARRSSGDSASAIQPHCTDTGRDANPSRRF